MQHQIEQIGADYVPQALNVLMDWKKIARQVHIKMQQVKQLVMTARQDFIAYKVVINLYHVLLAIGVVSKQQ